MTTVYQFLFYSILFYFCNQGIWITPIKTNNSTWSVSKMLYKSSQISFDGVFSENGTAFTSQRNLISVSWYFAASWDSSANYIDWLVTTRRRRLYRDKQFILKIERGSIITSLILGDQNQLWSYCFFILMPQINIMEKSQQQVQIAVSLLVASNNFITIT